MESYKEHNKDNKCEERFNKVKSYDYTWQWEYNSIVVFGGNWVSASYSGSRCSAWTNSPSNSDGSVSARGVCAPCFL
jgi:hypothetical protein